MPPLSVLLTGGAGFFGENVCRRLRADGHRVRVLDLSGPAPWAAGLGADWVQADVRDAAAVQRALDGCDRVVHAAFAPPELPPARVTSVNVGGTEAVLGAARASGGVPVVLVSSTIVDRPLRPHPVLSQAPSSRLAEYARTRRLAEDRARAAAAEGTPVALLRPKTFLGPGGVGAFAVLLGLVARGGRVPVLGSGRNRYQLLDVRDFAGAVSCLVDAGTSGTFGAGADHVRTVAEELGELLEHAGTGARLAFVPAAPARLALRAVTLAGASPLSEWHVCGATGVDSVLDTSALRSLGWRAERTGPQALTDAYDGYAAALQAGGPSHRVPASHRLAGAVLGLSRRR